MSVLAIPLSRYLSALLYLLDLKFVCTELDRPSLGALDNPGSWVLGLLGQLVWPELLPRVGP